MQISEIYRRGVVLGRSPQALQQLLANDVQPGSDVIYIPISSSLFSVLWKNRLFEELNKACGVNIDDYEEEMLPLEAIAAAESVVRKRKEIPSEANDLSAFYEGLLAMLQDARERQYPLFFVL